MKDVFCGAIFSLELSRQAGKDLLSLSLQSLTLSHTFDLASLALYLRTFLSPLTGATSRITRGRYFLAKVKLKTGFLHVSITAWELDELKSGSLEKGVR